MDPKSIFLSRTFWANIIALVATVFGAWGIAIPPDQQATVVAGVMATVNIALRCVTSRPVNLTGSSAWLLPLCAALTLSACSGDPTTDAAKVQGYVVAFTPIVDTAACQAQAFNNAIGAGATAAGNADVAAGAAAASAVTGAICYAPKLVAVPVK